LAARTAQINVLAKEVSPKPSDNIPLIDKPVNSSETNKHLVNKDLFKPPTTLADFYLVGGPPIDNSLDAGYDSINNIWGPKTKDNVNKPEAPVKELDSI